MSFARTGQLALIGREQDQFGIDRFDGARNCIGEIRIAYGGCGPNIIRLKKTEAALSGKPLNEEEIEAASELARSEITPISDVRGSSDYRFQLAENVLRKFYFDVTGQETYQRDTTPARVAPVVSSNAGGNGNGEPH